MGETAKYWPDRNTFQTRTNSKHDQPCPGMPNGLSATEYRRHPAVLLDQQNENLLTYFRTKTCRRYLEEQDLDLFRCPAPCWPNWPKPWPNLSPYASQTLTLMSDLDILNAFHHFGRTHLLCRNLIWVVEYSWRSIFDVVSQFFDKLCWIFDARPQIFIYFW